MGQYEDLPLPEQPYSNTNLQYDGVDTVLKNGALKTENYVKGKSGVSIENGKLEAQSAIIAGTIEASDGIIGGWRLTTNGIASDATEDTSKIFLDRTNSRIRVGVLAGNHILIDGANIRIRSSNYSAGVSGFNIEPDFIEAQNLRARGVLQSAVFQKDIISAVGGQLMVVESDILDEDMTANDNSTLTIKGDTAFAVNDILRIKDGVNDEWFRVTDISNAPTYTVTRDLADDYASNNNPTWTKGQAIVKQGVSDGASTYSGGWLELIGAGANAPYYSVKIRSGVAYNAITEIGRLGNLNGIHGITGDSFGIAIGDKSTGKYLTYDEQSGELIVNDSAILGQLIYGDGSDGNVTISSNTGLTRDMYYNNLTIETGITLTTNGYRVFVKNVLDLQGTGKIGWPGNAGTNGGPGGNGDYLSGVDAVGGTGGNGGAALSSGYLSGSVAGKNGTAGSAGGRNGAGSLGSSAGANGNNGTTRSLGKNGVAGVAGGQGTSYTSSAGTPGAGGGGGTEGTAAGIQPHNGILSIRMIDESVIGSPAAYTANAGPGGSSGGTGGAASSGATNAAGGGGGAGGSGSSAAIGYVAARRITGTGMIDFRGGNGGNGGAGGDADIQGNQNAGGGGGGAGGSGGTGGFLTLVYSLKESTVSVSVAGGVGGAGGLGGRNVNGLTYGTRAASGNNGNDGNDGTLLELQC